MAQTHLRAPRRAPREILRSSLDDGFRRSPAVTPAVDERGKLLQVWSTEVERTGLAISIVNPVPAPTRQGMVEEMRQMSRGGPAPRLVEPEEMVLPSFTSSRARSTASMAGASTLICGTHRSRRSRPPRRPPRRCRNPPAAGLMMRAAVIPPESQRGAGQRRASVRRGRQTWHCCTTGTPRAIAPAN